MKLQQPDLKLWLKAFTKKTEQDIEERKEKGRTQVLEYLEFAEQNPYYVEYIDDYTPGVEVPFQVKLAGITVKGAVDLILARKGGVEVRDLKTGNRESAMIQLGIYKVALEKILGWNVVAASFYYAKDRKVVTLTGGDLARYTEEYVTDLFVTLNKGIENKIFIPNPGQQCTMCPVKKFCREFS